MAEILIQSRRNGIHFVLQPGVWYTYGHGIAALSFVSVPVSGRLTFCIELLKGGISEEQNGAHLPQHVSITKVTSIEVYATLAVMRALPFVLICATEAERKQLLGLHVRIA